MSDNCCDVIPEDFHEMKKKIIKYISYSQTVPQFAFLCNYYCRAI